MRVGAVIVAAGKGLRMGDGSGPRKQYLVLNGKPVLLRTLEAFERTDAVAEIVVVLPGDDVEWVRREWLRSRPGQKTIRAVAGGPSRRESVALGLAALSPACRWVVVHDGARPLVTPDLIERVLRAAVDTGAAVAGVPVSDTVKRVDGDGRVVETLSRSSLRAIQTPQAFRRDLLERAHGKAEREGGASATDDAVLVERLGAAVRVVEGDPANIKLTRSHDLDVARAFLGARESAGVGRPETVPPLKEAEKASRPEVLPREDPGIRVGYGFDVHRLEEGRPLILGGVRIPWSKGLAGHSDADVLSHAITDALLGAAGLGDIGRHFPDTDPAYRGADSLRLLEQVVDMIAARGWAVGQVDATVVAERPKLAPHSQSMRENLAAVLRVDPGAVNVKASTSEGLGFTGRGEGMAAYAVATLVRTSDSRING